MRSKKHDVFAVMLHDRRVVNRLHRVRDIVLRENRVARVSSDDIPLHAIFLASISRTIEYTRSYCSTIVSMEKHSFTRCLHALRSISGTRSISREASPTLPARKP